MTLQTEIAIFLFFTIQVIFNICIVMKTDKIHESNRKHFKMLGILNDRLNLHSVVLFRNLKEDENK